MDLLTSNTLGLDRKKARKDLESLGWSKADINKIDKE